MHSTIDSLMSRRGHVLALSASLLLVACVVEPERRYPPPPVARVTYVEPGVVEIRAMEAPPPLPDYDQPPMPEDGYLWTPGYWHWSGHDYYWVPGTWVQPPQPGVLWTPAYWGYAGGAYVFHAGYWGPHVGFYGGVNYGHGYTGAGYQGAMWGGNRYRYNTAVTNVNTTVIHNTYNTTVVNNVTVNRVSYNGGAGGVAAQPNAEERVAMQERHTAPTQVQQQHVQEAIKTPALAAKANAGRPAIAATARPAEFNGPGAIGARGAGRAPEGNERAVAVPVAAPAPAAPAAQAPAVSLQAQPVQPQGRVQGNAATAPTGKAAQVDAARQARVDEARQNAQQGKASQVKPQPAHANAGTEETARDERNQKREENQARKKAKNGDEKPQAQ